MNHPTIPDLDELEALHRSDLAPAQRARALALTSRLRHLLEGWLVSSLGLRELEADQEELRHLAQGTSGAALDATVIELARRPRLVEHVDGLVPNTWPPDDPTPPTGPPALDEEDP